MKASPRLAFIILSVLAPAARPSQAREDNLGRSKATNPVYAGRSLDQWIELAEGPESVDALAAVRAIGEMGPRAAPAVPALARLLEDRSLRPAAAHALGEIGPEAAPAIPAMIMALKRDGFYHDHFHGGIIIPSIAKIGPAAVPALIALLEDRRSPRWEAIRAHGLLLEFIAPPIARIGPSSLFALAGRLEDRPQPPIEVVRALGRIGREAKEAMPHLAPLLSDPDATVRQEAAHALWKIGRHREAIPTLIGILEQGGPEYPRSGAAHALGEIGPDAIEAMPALIANLSDENDTIRGASANALGKIGPAAVKTVPLLLRLAAKGERAGYYGHLSAPIVQIGPGAIPALIDGLADGNPQVRQTAAAALGAFGPGKTEAGIPRLIAMTAEADPQNQIVAAMALWQIRRDSRTIPTLLRIIREGESAQQIFALGHLESLGPDAESAMPTIIDMLNHKNQFYRQTAAKVLGRIGPAAEVAAPALEQALRDEAEAVRAESALALWRISRHESALPALIADLQADRDFNSKQATLEAVGEIGPAAKDAVPPLIEILRRDRDNETSVISTLRKIGPPARLALPILIERYGAVHSLGREQFGRTIRAIDPGAIPDDSVPMMDERKPGPEVER